MRSARAYAEQLVRRFERTSLDSALLGGQSLAYARSRLWIVGPRALTRTLLHALELWVLTRDFPFIFLVPLLSLRTLPAAFSGFHWGALEALRESVRQDARRRPERARATTETWLAGTALSAWSVFALICLLVCAQANPEAGPYGLYGSFAIVAAFTTAIDLWTRTYYAGVYALGRAYRPLWTFFAPELVEVTSLLFTSATLGPFALHVAVLLGCLMRAGLTVYYTRRAYRARNLLLPRLFRLSGLKRLHVRDVAQAARHALAVTPQQLDRLLLLTLLSAPPASPDVWPLAFPYYAVRPLINLSQSWARVFFPDFVRLRATQVPALQLRFELGLRRAGNRVGLAAALSACAVAYFLFGTEGALTMLWFTPLCLVRSRFALLQVRDFAFGRHRALFVSSLVLGLGLVLLSSTHAKDRVVLVALVVVLLAVIFLQGKLRSSSAPALPRELALGAFLAQLHSHRGPVRLSLACVDRKLSRARPLLQRLAPRLRTGHVTRVSRSQLLFFESPKSALSRYELARLSGGAIQELRSVTSAEGAVALADASIRAALPVELVEALSAETAHESLLQRVERVAPGALVLDVDAPNSTLLGLPARHLTRVRLALESEARGRPHRHRAQGAQIAVYARCGAPKLVFVWTEPRENINVARQAIRIAAWRDSLKGPV